MSLSCGERIILKLSIRIIQVFISWSISLFAICEDLNTIFQTFSDLFQPTKSIIFFSSHPTNNYFSIPVIFKFVTKPEFATDFVLDLSKLLFLTPDIVSLPDAWKTSLQTITTIKDTLDSRFIRLESWGVNRELSLMIGWWEFRTTFMFCKSKWRTLVLVCSKLSERVDPSIGLQISENSSDLRLGFPIDKAFISSSLWRRTVISFAVSFVKL